MNRTKRMLFFIVGCLSLLALGVAAIAVVDFYIVLQKKESDLRQETLKDLALQESAMVEVKLEGYLHTLHVIAEFVRSTDLLLEENLARLDNLLVCKEFQRLGLVTLEGMLHSLGNEPLDISDREYFVDILQKKETITGVADSRLTGSKMFIVTVPVLDDAGVLKGAVHGSVSLEDFQMREGSRIGTDSGSVYVIDRQGNYILRGQEDDASWNASNLFEQIHMKDGNITVEVLRQQFQQDAVVLTNVFVEGVPYMACFSPISVNDWYAVVMMSTESIEKHVNFLLEGDFYLLLAKILLAVGLFCTVVILFIKREAKEEQKREMELRQRLLSGVIGFVVANLDTGEILRCSTHGFFQQYKELPYDQFMEQTVRGRVHEDHQQGLLSALLPEKVKNDHSKGLGEKMLEFLAYVDGENAAWVECERHMEKDEESGHLIVTYVLRDISEKKLDTFVWKTKAERDLLTGLYNRSAATERVDQYLRVSTPLKEKKHAFVILDLDNFKRLNDTLGHQVGDKALRDIAEILSNFFRKDDIVCRLGGDEYVVFIKDIAVEVFAKKMDSLMENLSLTYEKDGVSVEISASAGISTAPPHGTTFGTLYQCADKALYHAKRAGKSNYKIYDGHEGQG